MGPVAEAAFKIFQIPRSQAVTRPCGTVGVRRALQKRRTALRSGPLSFALKGKAKVYAAATAVKCVAASVSALDSSTITNSASSSAEAAKQLTISGLPTLVVSADQRVEIASNGSAPPCGSRRGFL